MLRRKKPPTPPPAMPSNMRVLRTPQELQAALLRAKELERRSQAVITARLKRYDSYNSTSKTPEQPLGDPG